MKSNLRKTKIVGTIGPASENRLQELFEAGLNVTRINYSHGSWDEQSEKTDTVPAIPDQKIKEVDSIPDSSAFDGDDGDDAFAMFANLMG